MQTLKTPRKEEQQGTTCVHETNTSPLLSERCGHACPECLGTCTLDQDHSGSHHCSNGHRW